MRDEIKEKISAFIDNEAHEPEIIELSERDNEVRATMARYSLISDVLNNRYSAGSYELSSKISTALDNEATLIAPRQWTQKPAIMKQVAGLAVAATVAAVAVLFVADFSAVRNEQTPLAVGPITEKPIRMTSEVRQKLNGYLVSHTEFSASSQMKGMLPYTRIASFPQGQSAAAPSDAIDAGAALEE
jgi:uncharacterized membrane protein YgcG